MKIEYWTPWPKQWKSGTHWFWVDLTFEWYKDVKVLCGFLFIFIFKTNCKIDRLDERDFRPGYGNWFESAILKLLDHSYVHIPFWTITRRIDKGI